MLLSSLFLGPGLQMKTEKYIKINIINKSVRLIMGSLDTKSSMRYGFKSSIRHDILETHLIL